MLSYYYSPAFLQEWVPYLRWLSYIFLVLVVLSIHSHWKKSSNHNLIRTNCKNAKTSLFVSLIGHHSAQDLSQCLFHLFENAACPTKINVAVYDITGGTALESYKRTSVKYGKLGRHYAENIVVLNRFAVDGGMYGALWDLFSYCYTNEDYVLTLSDNIIMNNNWDLHLIADCTSNNEAIVGTKNKFPVVQHFKNGMPTLTCKTAAQHCLLSKFWVMNVSFSKARFWKTMKRRKELHFLTDGTEVFMTSEAIHNNWKFKCPQNDIAQINDKKQSIWKAQKPAHFETSAKNASLLLRGELKQSLVYLNLNLNVGSNAIMGIVNENNHDEIIGKYGSIADYEYLKSHVINV